MKTFLTVVGLFASLSFCGIASASCPAPEKTKIDVVSRDVPTFFSGLTCFDKNASVIVPSMINDIKIEMAKARFSADNDGILRRLELIRRAIKRATVPKNSFDDEARQMFTSLSQQGAATATHILVDLQ